VCRLDVYGAESNSLNGKDGRHGCAAGGLCGERVVLVKQTAEPVTGWSSISIARAYPKVSVDGIDLDEASIGDARRNLAGSGVEERVRFHNLDAAEASFAHRFDLATIFEALHDMPRPVDVLRTIRGMLADGGSVLIADERTEDSFTAPSTDRERLYYGFSILACLPTGMVGARCGGDWHGHACGDAAPLCDAGRLLGRRRPADRERCLALLPAPSLKGSEPRPDP
jgi:SAM-dependent methyltransferase